MATCGRDRPTACFAFDGVNFTRRNILAFRIATDWPCVQQGQLVTQRGASLAASTSTCWMGLFRCFEIGGRITLSADLFSALHRPQ